VCLGAGGKCEREERLRRGAGVSRGKCEIIHIRRGYLRTKGTQSGERLRWKGAPNQSRQG